MTAKELLEDERYGYDHFTKLTSTGINPDEDNIAEFAEYYHKRKLNLLGIHIVSNTFKVQIQAEIDEAKRILKSTKENTEYSFEDASGWVEEMNLIKGEIQGLTKALNYR